MLAVLGDTHIPGRAFNIPPAFIREIQKAKPEKILFTGDAVIENPINQLKEIAPVVQVKGNVDRVEAPEKEIVKWDLKLLLLHGHQVSPRGDHEKLSDLGRETGCKIVVSGHTHTPEIVPGNILLINPGSATGVWGDAADTLPASMIFLESNQRLLFVRLLQLKGTDLVRQDLKIPLV